MIFFPSTHMIHQVRLGKFDMLREAILQNGVEVVDFSYKALDEEIGPMLVAALESLPIRCLNMSFNQLGPAGAIALADVIKDTPIVELDLSRNDIGVGASEVITRLKQTSVKLVNLAHNRIGMQGGSHLRSLLRVGDLKVNLSHNLIWA